MKNLIILFSVTIASFLSAQIGIGTTNPSIGASMDVQSSSKGVLFPRVALTNNTDQVTIPSPAVGLVVFNTQDSGSGNNVVKKDNFYFWDGVKWEHSVNSEEFTNALSQLKIPKLAGYMYKANPQRYDNPTGDMILTFDNPSNVFNFGEYMNFNPADTSMSSFVVNNTAKYGFEAFGCFLINVNVNDTIHPEVVFQRSTDNGATWNDTPIIGTVDYSRPLTTGLTIPINITGAMQLNAGDLLRMVVRIKFHTPTSSYSDVNYLAAARSNALGVQYSAGFKIVYYPE